MQAQKVSTPNILSAKDAVAKARQGDIQALQHLMESPLKSKNINVRVKRHDSSLAISLMGRKALSKKNYLGYVTQGLQKLGLNHFETVRVSAYQMGKFNPLWQENVDLHQNSTQRLGNLKTSTQREISTHRTPARSGIHSSSRQLPLHQHSRNRLSRPVHNSSSRARNGYATKGSKTGTGSWLMPGLLLAALSLLGLIGFGLLMRNAADTPVPNSADATTTPSSATAPSSANDLTQSAIQAGS